MKHLNFLLLFLLSCFTVACAGTDSTTGTSNASKKYEKLAEGASALTMHEDGWSIVSKMENGDRVYWFFAPDRNNVSPAVFRKTVFGEKKNKQGFEVISECEASKQVCDELMKQFNTLSEKYN